MSNYKGEIVQSSSLIHDTMNNQFAKKKNIFINNKNRCLLNRNRNNRCISFI